MPEVRGRGVPAIISPKPIGTLRKRMGLGNYAPYVGRLAKITRGNLDNKCIAERGAGYAHHAFLDSSKFDPEINTGELNPDVLCEAVLREFCQHL